MSNQSAPIVPHVLYVAEQRHPWRLALIERLAVRYHTPTTVRLVTGVQATKQQTHVYCLADDAAWERVQAQRAALQQAIDDLADALRQLGTYAQRLADAGGFKRAPNPLTATVISASDPDAADVGWYFSRLLPPIERQRITSHTPKMLRGPSSHGNWETTYHQRDHFVCPDDAAWAHVQQLEQTVKATAKEWDDLLRELGTYQAALDDGRYADLAPLASALVPPPLTSDQVAAPAPARPLYFPVARDELRAAGYRLLRTPDGRFRFKPPGEQAWQGYTPRHMIIEAQRLRDGTGAAAPLAIVEPVADGVVMMSADEARACVTRITGHLEDARRALLDLYEREGWKALGYASWRACAVAEFGQSAATLYRQLEAAQIERDISHDFSQVEKNAGAIPTAQLQPLKDLTPDERRAAWQQANDLAGDRPRTAAHVQQAAQAVKLPAVERRGSRPDQRGMIAANNVPKTDAGRVAAIRRFLDGAREAGRILTKDAFDTAWELAKDIHDGDTWRAICKEIHQATNSGKGAPVADPLAGDRQKLLIARTHLEIAAGSSLPAQVAQQLKDARVLLDQIGDVLTDERDALQREFHRIEREWVERRATAEAPLAVDAPAADTLKDQARARVAVPILRAETLLLQLVALAICDRDQRGAVADMPLAQLHELLIGRLFAGAWSDDPAPLLALLQLDAAAPASALSALAGDSPLAEIVATLAGVERQLRRELPQADVQEYQELLDRLMEDLEAQADAPDVSDAAYDALATRIGNAQRQLAERLAVESEVAA